MPLIEIIQILGVLATLTTLITGTAVYFLRNAATKVQRSNEELSEGLKSDNQELSRSLKEDVGNIERQLTANLVDLRNHIDGRIDNLRDRMDVKNKDVQEYVSNEVTNLKSRDADIELKLDLSREKINEIEKNLLEFKLEANEKYQAKGG